MPSVIAAPELITTAATGLANIGPTIGAADATAAALTTGVLVAGADEGVGEYRGVLQRAR